MTYICDSIKEIEKGEMKGIEIMNPRTEEGKPAQNRFQYTYCNDWSNYPINACGRTLLDSDSFRYSLFVTSLSNSLPLTPGDKAGEITYDGKTGALRFLFHDRFPVSFSGGGDLSPQQSLLKGIRDQFRKV